MWEKSQEIIVLEDERETEREEEENKELEAELAKGSNAMSVVETNSESGLPSLLSVKGEDAVSFNALVSCIDYRCEDVYFSRVAACGTISNPDSLPAVKQGLIMK